MSVSEATQDFSTTKATRFLQQAKKMKECIFWNSHFFQCRFWNRIGFSTMPKKISSIHLALRSGMKLKMLLIWNDCVLTLIAGSVSNGLFLFGIAVSIVCTASEKGRTDKNWQNNGENKFGDFFQKFLETLFSYQKFNFILSKYLIYRKHFLRNRN